MSKIYKKFALFSSFCFFIFGLGLFISGLIGHLLLNSRGERTGMINAKLGNSIIEIDNSNVNIWYVYTVASQEYQDFASVGLEFFNENQIDTVVIRYNKMFPSLNIIEGLPIKERHQKGNMMYGVLFIVLGLIFWKCYKPFRVRRAKLRIKKYGTNLWY